MFSLHSCDYEYDYCHSWERLVSVNEGRCYVAALCGSGLPCPTAGMPSLCLLKWVIALLLLEVMWLKASP